MFGVIAAVMCKLGNCDICAEQNILFINETKWYEIWLRPKG